MNQPKVSVIMPSLNVVSYIRECIESVVNQTLKDIEIICVDAGSTDGTLEVLEEYTAKDNRIKLLHSDKKSYGYQMNMGIDAATGEYIGIVETDDYIVCDAYEKLYRAAANTQAEIIKANYFEISDSDGVRKSTPCKLTKVKSRYGVILTPAEDSWLFYIPMMNVLGIFSLQFIRQNRISFNETPGASHQDMGFWFQTFAVSKRVLLIDEEYYCYRIDNPNSSINNRTKVFCVSDEYKFIKCYLEERPEIFEAVAPMYYHRMFTSYLFTFNKLAEHLKPLFLIEAFQKDMLDASKSQYYSETRFNDSEKTILHKIVSNPHELLAENHERENEALKAAFISANSKIDEYRQELELCRKALSKKEQKDYEIKVSVVVPVYNTSKYLFDCIDSICNQTLREIEVLCVDDGSTDKSLEILREYETKDKRVHVFENSTNMGQSFSRNKALSHARGEFIYCMDSDDILDTTALDYLYTEAQKCNLDVLYFDASTFYENESLAEKYSGMANTYLRKEEYSNVVSGTELLEIFQRNNEYRVSPCLQFIRKTLLVENNISFYEGIIYEDNLFALEIILSAKRVSHRRKSFFHRRIRSNSSTITGYTFKAFYGYFVCWIQMYAMQIKYEKDDRIFNEIEYERNMIKKALVRIFNSLDTEEKKKIQFLSLSETRLLYDVIPPSGAVSDSKNKDILEFKLSSALKEIANIKASKTYLIGSIITFLPRKIRGVYRCYKEHGVRYTFREIKKTLLRKGK